MRVFVNMRRKRPAALLRRVLLCFVVILLSGALWFTWASRNRQATPSAKHVTANTNGQSSAPKETNPLHNIQLFVDPASNAAVQAAAWRKTKPNDAAAMDKLAARPTAKWLTSSASLAELDAYMSQAAKQQAVPVLVSYFIPLRDCSLYSAGGAKDADDYQRFITTFAQKIGTARTVVILEPDALAGLYTTDQNDQPCLSQAEQALRYSLIGYAVEQFKALPATTVYIDAGHSQWITDTGDMANRLQQAKVDAADGFSLNVSNFQTNAANIKYGTAIAQTLGGKHFVIDTSRNGLGPYANTKYPSQNWCNPPGRALGTAPTTDTGNTLVDAYLYVKSPGESDGTDTDPNKCFRGPAAGVWWPTYALGLIARQPN